MDIIGTAENHNAAVHDSDTSTSVKCGSIMENQDEIPVQYSGADDDDDDDDDDDEDSDSQFDETNGVLHNPDNSTKEFQASTEKPEGLTGYKIKKVLKYDFPMNVTEPLPDGWVMSSHTLGIPIYLHKKTRVVTWSRPYSLASGHVKQHDIPLHSIPCLHYLKSRLKMEECDNKPSEETSIEALEAEATRSQPKAIIHQQKDLSLGNEELTAYLEKRFDFKILEIPQFQKWSQRRKYNRSMRRKNMQKANSIYDESIESDETKATTAPKLITLTVEQEDRTDGSTRNRKLVLNTTGKPMICVLHEYAQRVLRAQPQYIFDIHEDSAAPFEASIKLNDKTYGRATAISKKAAKNKAALATLELLIPGFKGQVESNQGTPDMKCFADVSVTDSRVHELCIHTGQLLPYQLLTECLKRHQGVADTTVSFDVQQGKKRYINYTMTCGKHVVTGSAKNKKIAKQQAAQQILQFLHPEVKTWAELTELYGTSLAQERARRKQEEQQIFDLKQRKGQNDEDSCSSKDPVEDKSSLEPNPELLAKLREMMFKLQAATSNKRKRESDESCILKKRKMTPMAAAILAGKELMAPMSEESVAEASQNLFDS